MCLSIDSATNLDIFYNYDLELVDPVTPFSSFGKLKTIVMQNTNGSFYMVTGCLGSLLVSEAVFGIKQLVQYIQNWELNWRFSTGSEYLPFTNDINNNNNSDNSNSNKNTPPQYPSLNKTSKTKKKKKNHSSITIEQLQNFKASNLQFTSREIIYIKYGH